MKRQVIYRDRQEYTGEDGNNSQIWRDESLQAVITDAITTESQFTGLTVTMRSSSEIAIAPGNLYIGSTGELFGLDEEHVASVFTMLPTTNTKWIAVSVFGQQEEVETESRDFLINLATLQTQPNSVAMEKRRVIVPHIAQGLESPTPEKPEPPTGYTLIAHVKMSPSGIQQIIIADSRRLPNLNAVETRVKATEGWIQSAGPRIDHIVSDIAGLGEAVAGRATIQQLLAIAMDMARLKERAEIPDDYIFYGADHYLNADESDTEAVGYSAQLQEGIRPAVAAQDAVSLALLNPLDPAARLSDDDFLLPAYTELTRLRMETRIGDTTINQYEYQTSNLVQRSMSRQRIRYGEAMTLCTNSGFWRSGQYDPVTGIYRTNGESWEVDPAYRQNMILQVGQVRATQFWQDSYVETYWDAVTTEHTIQGSQLAQTILMAQTGWLTSIEVYFTNVDPAAGMTLVLTDASRGQPDLDYGIARVVLAANALSAGWIKITFPRPVFVESGRRYAIVLVSAAQHKVGYTQGTDYTQGVLMYAQGGSFSVVADERDLMLRLNFAQFTTPRAVIHFEALQLAGGISSLDWLYEGVTPDGTEIYWEYQVAGIWYPVKAGSAASLSTRPAMLPIRAILIGTTDVMPAFLLDGSQVIVSRAGTSFTHFSTLRTLADPSEHIVVRLLLEDFDETPHNVDCKLIIDDDPVDATSYKDEVVDSRSRWREFLFELGATTEEYAIKITGSTSNWRQAWHVAERYDLAL